MRIALVTTDDTVDAANDSCGEVTSVVGDNLRRFRTRHGLSLERLAKASGVSRAMLGQIELGRSSPTINVLWKIAKALDVPLAAFVSQSSETDITILRAHRSKWLNSNNGRFATRTLSPSEAGSREELNEVRLLPQSIEEEEGHSSGCTEYVVVAKGVLEVRINSIWHRMEKGDSASFSADRSHAYRNPGSDETLFYVFKVSPAL